MEEESNSNDMQARIKAALAQIENNEEVTILYACESGSRAWGFASAESDFDVRFLYTHPIDRYLRLDEPRDVLEYPVTSSLDAGVPLDISGWDMHKALRLLRKSNPSLLEWLESPVIYRESPVVTELREYVRQHFAYPAVFYHYRQMARHNWHQYIKDKEQVLRKKYLYVLRPLIALCYLEEHKTFPPIYFPRVLNDTPLEDSVRSHIEQLIDEKQAGSEMALGPADPVLNTFVDQQFARWSEPVFPALDYTAKYHAGTQQLNLLWQKILTGES